MIDDFSLPEPGSPFGCWMQESLDAAGVATDLAETEAPQ